SQYVKGDLSKLTAQIVYEAANDGDEWALEVVRETASLLGAAVASFLNIFNPEVVVICVGVTQAGDRLFFWRRRGFHQKTPGARGRGRAGGGGKALKRVGVIGSMVWDTIYGPDP